MDKSVVVTLNEYYTVRNFLATDNFRDFCSFFAKFQRKRAVTDFVITVKYIMVFQARIKYKMYFHDLSDSGFWLWPSWTFNLDFGIYNFDDIGRWFICRITVCFERLDITKLFKNQIITISSWPHRMLSWKKRISPNFLVHK